MSPASPHRHCSVPYYIHRAQPWRGKRVLPYSRLCPAPAHRQRVCMFAVSDALYLVDQMLEEVPEEAASLYGAVAKELNLSENCLR